MKLRKLALICCSTAVVVSTLIPAGAVMAEEAAEMSTISVVDAAAPIQVTGGQITGTRSEDGEVAIYKGIPYAAAPIGDLRFANPEDVIPWDGVRSCDTFGNIAYQNWPDFSMPWMKVYSPEFLASEERGDVRSEDCLYLNVWTKQGEVEAPRPVVVYLHGGGFGEGAGSFPVYDGTHLAEDGIVYVSINYRLGIQGFLTTEELDEENPYHTSGNYAIVDMVKSLEWVRDNISQFGGDPDNVTIAGQSAGGLAVNTLINTHIAKGLFNKAAVFSGGYINMNRGSLSDDTTKEDAQAAFKEAYPDVTIAQLRELPLEDLFANYSCSTVVVDHGVITEGNVQNRLEGKQNPVNLMIGYVEGDTGLFSGVSGEIATVEDYEAWAGETFGEEAEKILELYPAATDEEAAAMPGKISVDRMIMSAWAEAALETSTTGKDAFIYYIDHQAPAAEEVGMFHTGDIPYWLGGTLTIRAEYETDVDHAMYQTMKSYFEHFIANGDPNGEGLPAWDKFDGSYKYLMIGDDTYEMLEIPQEIGDYWVGIANRIYGIDFANLK